MSMKVLVVEDDADSREMLEVLLTCKGFSVTTAADGYEGLEQARANPPDVILTDLHMPNLNGIEMVKRLRCTPEFVKTLIIALSADSWLRAEAMAAGADQFLTKPLPIDTLLSIL